MNQPQPTHSPQVLKELIDRAGVINAVVLHPHRSLRWQHTGSGKPSGFQLESNLRKLDNEIHLDGGTCSVRASNRLSETLGSVTLHCQFIPWNHSAHPQHAAPAEPYDSATSQRFTLAGSRLTFANGDALELFGTGRTFPVVNAGKLTVMAGAVAEITGATGHLAGLSGNVVLAGEIDSRNGFTGNVLVRLADSANKLRTDDPPAASSGSPISSDHPVFLSCVGEKGEGADQANAFSMDPTGAPRGMNIPTILRSVQHGCRADGADGLRTSALLRGVDIGREIGFGRGSLPEAPPTGTQLSPYAFEGVASYSFHSPDGWNLGSLTTNILEGRRFDLPFADAPGELSWRFGFFGPIIRGTGCFRAVQGLFYGASASVFRAPPEHHIVTHYYAAMLLDPHGRYRAG